MREHSEAESVEQADLKPLPQLGKLLTASWDNGSNGFTIDHKARLFYNPAYPDEIMLILFVPGKPNLVITFSRDRLAKGLKGSDGDLLIMKPEWRFIFRRIRFTIIAPNLNMSMFIDGKSGPVEFNMASPTLKRFLRRTKKAVPMGSPLEAELRDKAADRIYYEVRALI